MPSLQYVIDTICASVTEESMYELIEKQLEKGSFVVDEILPLIQSQDRSLDLGSAKMLAEAALQSLAQRGDLQMYGEYVYPVK